jgi:hypothetical protein
MQTEIAPSFKQPEGDVLGGADTFRKGAAKETTVFDELR